MKQFQFEYDSAESFTEKLAGFRNSCDSTGMKPKLFQVYSEVLYAGVIHEVCGVIERFFSRNAVSGMFYEREYHRLPPFTGHYGCMHGFRTFFHEDAFFSI